MFSSEPFRRPTGREEQNLSRDLCVVSPRIIFAECFDILKKNKRVLKKHKSLNNPLRACAYKVTYDYRIVTVNININQDVLRTYIEHGADCLEIYVLLAEKCYN